MSAIRSVRLLNRLIEMGRDGKEDFVSAAAVVQNRDLYLLLVRIAASKHDLVLRLSTAVVDAGQRPARFGTLCGRVRRTGAKVRAAFGDHDNVYMRILAGDEAHLLQMLERARIETGLHVTAEAAIVDVLPLVRESHAALAERRTRMRGVQADP